MKKTFFVIPMLFLFLFYSPLYAVDETVNYTYDALDRLIGVEYVGKGSVSYTYDGAGDIIHLTILVNNSTVVDIDHDGIADDWEMFFFNNLTTASATTDGDHDGYTDLWEYLNWEEYLLDSNGFEYSPVVANSANGRGYKKIALSAVYLLLLK